MLENETGWQSVVADAHPGSWSFFFWLVLTFCWATNLKSACKFTRDRKDAITYGEQDRATLHAKRCIIVGPVGIPIWWSLFFISFALSFLPCLLCSLLSVPLLLPPLTTKTAERIIFRDIGAVLESPWTCGLQLVRHCCLRTSWSQHLNRLNCHQQFPIELLSLECASEPSKI